MKKKKKRERENYLPLKKRRKKEEKHLPTPTLVSWAAWKSLHGPAAR